MPSYYQREVYDGSRGTGRMSDLLMRRGEIQARAALQRGDIAAQTAQNLASIVGQTATGIARNVQEQREQAAAAERQKKIDARNDEVFGWQRNEQMRRETAQKQADAATGQELNERVTSAQYVRADGSYDVDGLKKAFDEAGIADRFPSVLEKIKRTEATSLQFKTAQMAFAKAQAGFVDDLAATAQHVISLGVDPMTAVRTQVAKAKASGMDAAMVDDILKQAEAAPDKIPALLSSLRRPDDKPKEPKVYKEGDVIVNPDGTERKIPKTRAPGEGGDAGMTVGQRNAAERDKQSRLADAERLARKKVDDAAGLLREKDALGEPKLSRQEFDRIKAEAYAQLNEDKRRIQAGYEAQVGVREDAPVPAAPAPKPSPAPAPAPAARPSMSDLMPGGMRPQRTGAGPVAPAGAPTVGAVVTRQGKRYRIEKVNPDGTVVATPLE